MDMSHNLREFTETEHHTWKQLFERQTPLRREQIIDDFSKGIEALELCPDEIPDLEQVNSRLKRKTGFRGVPVEGLEGPVHFFQMLARREFPIGNFIRDSEDLNYTPAPDVFHDLYGHLPFFAASDYADFCEHFGRKASEYCQHPQALREFERLFWFTLEFALIKTSKGNRILGAGIASSFTECEYALSPRPEILPFNLRMIRDQEYRIDQLQNKLFILENKEQLFSCLPEFEQILSPDYREGSLSCHS